MVEAQLIEDVFVGQAVRRVARRCETRSDKIFELPQCGTPLDFSRGRAAFRCVSPIEGERPGP